MSISQFLTKEQSASYFRETTVAVGPADWAAEGTPFEYISVDLANVKEERLTDMTAESRVRRVAARATIAGKRTGSFEQVLKLHSTGVVTAPGATVVKNYIGEMIECAWGGCYLGKSTTITGGTATAPIVDDVTGIVPGMLLAFESLADADYEGLLAFRRVLAVNAGTKVVTLSEALPWTPAADDIVHGTITNYVAPHVLRDAVLAGSTYSVLVQLGDDESLVSQMLGCVCSAKFENLGPGALATLNLSWLNGNFDRGAEDGMAYIPDLGERVGGAQLSMHNCSLSIQEAGNTAINSVHYSAISIDTGLTRTPVPSGSDKNGRFQLATYSMASTPAKISVTISGYSNEFYSGLKAGKVYRISFANPGSGAGAGSGFAWHAARCRLAETPGRADVGDNHGVTLTFICDESNDTTGGANVDLQVSSILFAQA